MKTEKTLLKIATLLLITTQLSELKAQMQTGTQMKDWHSELNLPPGPNKVPYRIVLLESNAPANIFWPGEKAKLTFQIQNHSSEQIKADGQIELIEWKTEGIPGDIWLPQVRKVENLQKIPISINLPPVSNNTPSWKNITIEPNIPEKKHGWMLILDLGKFGRSLITHGVRTFPAEAIRIRHPHQSMEEMPPAVLQRLNIRAIRMGIPYFYGANRDERYKEYEHDLIELHKHNVTVLLEFGEGGAPQPLGRPRPHLDKDGVMLSGKADHVWLPELDQDFKSVVKRFATQYGWPKGPVTGIMLWNEPWEGHSISGWQADMIRYRDLYRLMGEAIHEAEKESGVQLLLGGCDSSTNTWDKLFPDASDEFLKYLDFCSIHYQGLNSPANFKYWLERKDREGRVLIFDTESWVANTDDRFAGVVATNRAAGYDRAMGVFGGNVVDVLTHRLVRMVDVWTENGHERRKALLQAYPLAAAVGASQYYIGEREFNQILFEKGLPYVFVFNGYNNNKADGTIVILGDMDALFDSGTALWSSTASLDETKKRLSVIGQIKKTENLSEKLKLYASLRTRAPYTNANFIINAGKNPRFALFDFYGNQIPPAEDGLIVIPLDHRAFFLRATDNKPESFDDLLNAVRNAKLEGLEPVHILAKDFLDEVNKGTTLRLELTNHHNQEITGDLKIEIEGLAIKLSNNTISIPARKTISLEIPVIGNPRPDNTYHLILIFDAKDKGLAVHYEPLHVNLISRKTITVDGNLEDWKGALAQPIYAEGSAERTLTEAAWLPFENFTAKEKDSKFATAWLAYDENFFYFSARVSDSTPDPGTLRFSQRNDDAFFYPQVSYSKIGHGEGEDAVNFSARWTGFIKARQHGIHKFICTSDDGVRLWINNKQLINDWVPRSPTESIAEIELKKDQLVPLKIEYFQAYGGAVIKFEWIEPNGQRSTVPEICLFTDQIQKENGLKAEFFPNTELSGKSIQSRIDKTIFYNNWPGNISEPEFGLKASEKKLIEHHWPEGVRHFSYRCNPILPAGNRSPDFDNIQIAFNVLPPDQQGISSTIDPLPGRPKGFIPVVCTDYEYALNQVAPEYGGGFEIWRLSHPSLPRKHFYPRQPKAPAEGPVENAKMITIYKDGLRITEAAIPWDEIPHVKKALDEGKSIKFSYRVNHTEGGPCMELARKRSVSRRTPYSFHVDWAEHWANEIEFKWEK